MTSLAEQIDQIAPPRHLHYILRCHPSLKKYAQDAAHLVEQQQAGRVTYWVKLDNRGSKKAWKLIGPYENKPDEPGLLPSRRSPWFGEEAVSD